MTPQTSAEHIIAWIRHLTTEVNSNWKDANSIHLGEHDKQVTGIM